MSKTAQLGVEFYQYKQQAEARRNADVEERDRIVAGLSQELHDLSVRLTVAERRIVALTMPQTDCPFDRTVQCRQAPTCRAMRIAPVECRETLSPTAPEEE